MKNLSIILLLIGLNSTILFADYQYDSLTVIAQPNLALRVNTNKNSELLASMPFGAIVRAYWDNVVKDTINGVHGQWKLVEYNQLKGYAWDPYLSMQRIASDKLFNTDFRIMEEGTFCAELNYSSDLYWYGLYTTDSKETQELLNVNINLIFQQTLKKDDKEKYFGNDFEIDFQLSTDNKKKSVFLIGSKEPLKVGKIKGFLFEKESYSNNKPYIFLYPEQIKNLEIDNMELAIRAKEEVYITDSSKYIITKFYELELAKDENAYYSYNDFFTQNISKDIPHMSSPAFRHCIYKNPKIVWYGDLDGDKKIDFIINSFMMADHGGVDTNYILFLSSKADGKNFVKKVAHFMLWGCYG